MSITTSPQWWAYKMRQYNIQYNSDRDQQISDQRLSCRLIAHYCLTEEQAQHQTTAPHPQLT